jgi:hypothetical protein
LYRPPDNNQKYAEDHCRTISSLSTLYRDSTIWIGGDANLPDIEWDTTSIKGNRYAIPINNTIINTMFDAGCEQVVNFATRAVNTLDLFFTNRPSLVNKCLPLPGLSDHDIVLVDTNITPARQNPLKRLIYLWKKVNITNMANNVKVSLDKFMDCSDIKTPINNLWADFKTICLDNLRKHVPSKHTSTRYSQPWCNRNIRRLSRRKQGAFNKYRKTGKKERLGPISPTTEIDPKKNINHHISNM